MRCREAELQCLGELGGGGAGDDKLSASFGRLASPARKGTANCIAWEPSPVFTKTLTHAAGRRTCLEMIALCLAYPLRACDHWGDLMFTKVLP
jgi:hypothetical protein